MAVKFLLYLYEVQMRIQSGYLNYLHLRLPSLPPPLVLYGKCKTQTEHTTTRGITNC